MEYIVFFSAIGLFFLFVFLKGVWDNCRHQKILMKQLKDNYGKQPDREYKAERFLRIGSYYERHPEDGQIDDNTWQDLNMDEIFKRMNYTLSSAGEEYLYYTLRTPKFSEDALIKQEKIVDYFIKNADMRLKVQLLLKRLGTCDKYSLYDYLDYMNALEERTNRKQLIIDCLLFPFLILCFYRFSLGIAGIAVLLAYNITTYFKEKKQIAPYIISFGYVMRLLKTGNDLVKLDIPVCETQWREIKRCENKLAGMKRGSGLVFSASNGNTGGNPLEIIMDYMNMMFHIDIMIFHKMLGELKSHYAEVDNLVRCVGAVETAICIGAYRESLKGDWCRPVYSEASNICLKLEYAYHPLLKSPVKNNINTKKGVLLTGSNASGKSTFLKTVAINAILAQTIMTCCAGIYEAPFYRIFTSMSLRDNVETGDSYYIVEIKSLKRILTAAESGLPVLCFVDEVLRGTNTVERIAASTQILLSLCGCNVICFAATHDIELTELLNLQYDNYHFEENIVDGDIRFNYKLMQGKATTRNAIKLLTLMGYDEKITTKAMMQAECFVDSGVWKLS